MLCFFKAIYDKGRVSGPNFGSEVINTTAQGSLKDL